MCVWDLPYKINNKNLAGGNLKGWKCIISINTKSKNFMKFGNLGRLKMFDRLIKQQIMYPPAIETELWGIQIVLPTLGTN